MAQAEQDGLRHHQGTPLLEWIAAAIGLLVTLAMLGFVGWQAWTTDSIEPPALDLQVRRILPAGNGWVVDFEARNLSPKTAAAVVIEGELTSGDRVVATSEVTLDYVPGRSVRQGGLFFEEDPAQHRLRLRALGYAEP